jgi:hypothetical protein
VLAAVVQVLRDVLTPSGQVKVLTAAIVGAVLGSVLGLIPFLYGRRRGLDRLGSIGLGASAMAGLVFGVWLSLPVAIGFTIAIWNAARRSSRAASRAEQRGSPSLFS